MIEYIVLSIIIVAFIIASIEDIKKREVYDYINYSLTFVMIAIAIFHSLIIESIDPIKYVGFGLLLGFLFGAILFYLGIWGGGDAKFLIGFGASIYYIQNFVNVGEKIDNLYYLVLDKINYGLTMFIDYFLNYILIIDAVFLVLIIITTILLRNKFEFKKQINLFSTLFLLFIGLYLDYSNLMLILLGFTAFLLIFFGDDEMFASIYLKIKKKIKNLEEGDKIDSNIEINKKEIVNFEEGHLGLTKQNLISLKEHNFKERFVYVRHILPYSILIGLNYIVYMINIITLDNMNLKILAFLLKFMYYSFLTGGIIAILILLYCLIKNFKKINFNLNLVEKILLGLTTIIVTALVILINAKLSMIYILIFLYIFLKIAKQAETLLFVKKKDINKVVPGDWIAEDIYVKEKLIYSIDDFELGIEEKQIEHIKELSKKNHHLKQILVKDGLAFLPPLFIGFLIMILLSL